MIGYRLTMEEIGVDEYGNEVKRKYYEKDSFLDSIKEKFTKKDEIPADSDEEEKPKQKLNKKKVAAVVAAGAAGLGALVFGISKMRGNSDSDDDEEYYLDGEVSDDDVSEEDSDVVAESEYVEA